MTRREYHHYALGEPGLSVFWDGANLGAYHAFGSFNAKLDRAKWEAFLRECLADLEASPPDLPPLTLIIPE